MWTVKRPLAKTQGFLVNFVDWGTGSGDPLTLHSAVALQNSGTPESQKSGTPPYLQGIKTSSKTWLGSPGPAAC